EPGKGVLYVTTDKSPPPLSPVPADKQASFLLSENWLDDTDPGHAFPGPMFRAQLEYATGAQLLNYPDASGMRGARLVPEVAGTTVSGDRLRIRLVAPAGDFLTRLSLPYFAAVPVDTPIVNGGVQTPIPSAGPYYVAVSFQGELLVLERNPNYHGPRPARLE